MSELNKYASRIIGPAALQRGRACLNCRRRKMKCDGARPVCGPCSRSAFTDDCEYADSYGRSRTQMLEETIFRLEERIEELENPERNAVSVLLHDPLVAFRRPSPTCHGSPNSGRSSPSSSIFSHCSQSTAGTSSTLEDVIPGLTSDLIDSFFKNAGALPWFLHEGRFRESLVSSPGNLSRPIPALLSSILLWAAKINPTCDLASLSTNLLSRALSQVGLALKDGPSHQVVQAIQTHVLLAVYLYTIGRFLEGRQQTSAAASLAIDCGLHRIRSSRDPAHYAAYVDTMEVILPEPHDQTEEGERIDAFWTAFCQDRAWSVALGAPAIIAEADASGMQIDTPWSIDMTLYENSRVHPSFRSAATVKTFFAGTATSMPAQINNSLTQMSKACALFERATTLAKTWRQDFPDPTAYYASAMEVEQRIEELKSQILPFSAFTHLAQAALQKAHFVHCLVYSSTIQLHSSFVRHNASSRSKCLDAACGVICVNEVARVQEFVFLDSVIGSAWAAACRVFISEIILLRAAQSGINAFPQVSEVELIGALNKLQALMAIFAPTSALIDYQLGKILQERNGI